MLPEGSPERIDARQRLCRMAWRSANTLERPAEEWEQGIRRQAPQLVEAVGDRDMRAIVAWAWRQRAA